MKSGKAVILNEKGLHLRPVGMLCNLALTFPCKAELKVRDYRVSAKSVLGVLSAGIKFGEEVEIVCDGEKEEEALSSILNLLSQKFNEE